MSSKFCLNRGMYCSRTQKIVAMRNATDGDENHHTNNGAPGGIHLDSDRSPNR